MNNLREGKLDIKGIQINEGTQLSDFEDPAKKDNEIEVSKGKNGRASVGFSESVKIGSKNFLVLIFFDNNRIKGIELKVDDPTINEWDYESLMDQHSDWIEEQIGYPASTLPETIYDWGRVSQWYDPRARDAGIRILYY